MKKEFDAVVRHYHCADRQAAYEKRGQNHPPYSYSGLLKKGHDLDGNVKDEINAYLRTLPDGERVKITIEGKGKAPSAQAFVWAWTKPHTYERIPEADYLKMVELEKTGEYKTEAFHKHKCWHEDVTSIASDKLRSEGKP